MPKTRAIFGLMGLDFLSVLQGEFDFDASDTRHRSKLMGAMDSINDRYGRGAMGRRDFGRE
jgi:hypothetical protein